MNYILFFVLLFSLLLEFHYLYIFIFYLLLRHLAFIYYYIIVVYLFLFLNSIVGAITFHSFCQLKYVDVDVLIPIIIDMLIFDGM